MGAATVGLLERDQELASIGGLLEQARAGDGQLALVEGPAGIGKTAILEAVCALAVEEGFEVLGARGAELEREFPFGLVRQLFEPALRRLSSRERKEVMSGAAALAEHALGHSTADPGDASALPAALHGLYWLAANLAERAPLLLAVDDALWGDLPSLRWLCYLARRLDGVSLVALVATRPGASESVAPLIDELRREPDVRIVALAPLSEDGVRGLVEGTFGVTAASEFVHACHQQSAGNPLLTHELAKALIADGARPDESAAGRVRSLPPREALRAVLVKLGRLPAAAAALARAVAVLETDVGLRDAAALAGLDERVAVEAADSLVAAGILVADPLLRFVHPLLRAAVYDDIPAARRASDHARAAALLRSDSAASERATAHLLACEPTGEGWVIEHLRAAAGVALSRGAPETAVAVLERCLAERPPRDVRAAVLRALGKAERRIASPSAVEHLVEAHETTSDALERIAIARELAAAMTFSARVHDAYELLERTLAQVPGDDRELALGIEAELLTAGLIAPGLSERVKERIARIPQLRGDTPGERLVLANIARHRELMGESAQDAADMAERAIAGGQLLFDQTPDSGSFALALVPMVVAGRYESVKKLCDYATADARTRGSPLGLAQASAVRAFVHFWSGDLRAAESDGQTGLELGLQSGFLPIVASAVRLLVEVALERGRLDYAEALLVDNHLAGEVPDVFVFFNFVLFARGRLRLAQGRTDEGIADLLELGERETRRRATRSESVASGGRARARRRGRSESGPTPRRGGGRDRAPSRSPRAPQPGTRRPRPDRRRQRGRPALAGSRADTRAHADNTRVRHARSPISALRFAAPTSAPRRANTYAGRSISPTAAERQSLRTRPARAARDRRPPAQDPAQRRRRADRQRAARR